MGLSLKNIAESINIWNNFMPEIIDWEDVRTRINGTLSDWYKTYNGESKELYTDELTDRLYVSGNGIDEENEELYKIRVILDKAACTIRLQTGVLEYDHEVIRKEDIARIMNRLNRHLEAGRVYQEYNNVYYSEGIDVREDGTFDQDSFINAIKRSRMAIHLFAKGGKYILKNESFISTLYRIVPRIESCDECSVWSNGSLIIDDMHLERYAMSVIGINENLNRYGCIFIDMDGYIMLTPSWYGKHYEYILQRRIEHGEGYEDIDFLKMALRTFRESYSEIKSEADKQESKHHYFSGLSVELKPSIKGVLGDAAVIMLFDNGRAFLAPKEIGYIMQMFSKGKMEEWEKNHKRLGYGDAPLTEDERSLEWIRADEPEEHKYDD